MIISENERRSSTRRLRACVLACAMVVLPFGLASAQDYEAVGRRLQAAVAAGEMTKDEARAKWEAIKKDAAAKDKGND